MDIETTPPMDLAALRAAAYELDTAEGDETIYEHSHAIGVLLAHVNRLVAEGQL